MSFNLANQPAAVRQAVEDEKARLFAFWQQNLERAKNQAGKYWSEKTRRRAQWRNWVEEELATLSPEQFQSMVRKELRRLSQQS